MGMDVHIMVIPAGMSTANVPLPHPFIGKINDKVSDDVKIKDKGVAVKGSKAKHDDSMHMQLPGTIKFQSNPKKEGEVTGGTGSKVKVNGKEVAVIGSMVTTCNDMGMQNNSTIIAVGASIPMTAIINPKNTEEFNREREEQEKLEPAFQNVKWGSTSVEEGEEAELSAGVKDIADGNMVTLMVFPEGKGPEVGGDIKPGQLVALAGNTGSGGGITHLHLEVFDIGNTNKEELLDEGYDLKWLKTPADLRRDPLDSTLKYNDLLKKSKKRLGL